jgi:hypothetical protein
MVGVFDQEVYASYSLWPSSAAQFVRKSIMEFVGPNLLNSQ